MCKLCDVNCSIGLSKMTKLDANIDNVDQLALVCMMTIVIFISFQSCIYVQDLYRTIVGLSYLGDIRMGLAEDSKKVERIAAGSSEGLNQIYRPLFQVSLSIILDNPSMYSITCSHWLTITLYAPSCYVDAKMPFIQWSAECPHCYNSFNRGNYSLYQESDVECQTALCEIVRELKPWVYLSLGFVFALKSSFVKTSFLALYCNLICMSDWLFFSYSHDERQNLRIILASISSGIIYVFQTNAKRICISYIFLTNHYLQ